ncbi:MAG TPA: hypothetical protein VHA78_02295 [Candidatus Peribacteraceae bacterium]|nr:hypothetical protein [Candidatus Peribacteraceae bacterium]
MATEGPEEFSSPEQAQPDQALNPAEEQPNPDLRKIFEEERKALENVKQQTTHHLRGSLHTKKEPGTDDIRRDEEAEREKRRILQAEKIKNLRFEVLTPAHLDHVAVLYNKHLLSTEALEKWVVHGNSEQISEEVGKRGQMFNEFDPDPETLAEYRKINPDYISVREQMQRDMEESEKGDSARGSYLVVGLYDDKKPDVLRGYLSLRYPPQDPELKKIYAASMTAALADKDKISEKELQFNREWVIDRMVKEFPDMAEIDTINIEHGFSGASYALLYKAIEHMRARGFNDPGSIIYYRSHTMTLHHDHGGGPLTEQNILEALDNLPDGDEDAPDTVNVQNLHSARFFSSLGYTEMLIRSEPTDVVVRRMGNGQWAKANMQWQYGHEKFSKMMERLTNRMHERHLLG